jgi:hypothetical protein
MKPGYMFQLHSRHQAYLQTLLQLYMLNRHVITHNEMDLVKIIFVRCTGRVMHRLDYIPCFVRPEVPTILRNKNVIIWNTKPLSIIDG